MPFEKDKMHWNYKHGHRKVNDTSGAYASWLAMKHRCNPKNAAAHPNYAGRGINICNEWNLSFERFLEDMGCRPEKTTLDRIDPSRGYFKENCRWATSKQQARNKRTSVFVDFFGKKTLAIDIASEFGIPATTLYRRIKQGYKNEDIIDKSNKNKLITGESKHSSKLTCKDVEKIKLMLDSGFTQSEIARQFGITQSVVSNIKTGKLWKTT